jgi:hypothetical protein
VTLWAGTEPQDPPDPDWDDLTRTELTELAGQPAADLADTLDEWLHRCHGIASGTHNAGLFADLLAARGWRIHRIDPGPPFDELLPASPD